jgi:alpha-beta hydrolase superfamily lysophospholipase
MNYDSRQADHSTGTFKANGGTQLFEQWWQPVAETKAKAVLVIVHGLAEHSGRYAQVANYLGEHGYAVATFDLRGHGRSEGHRAYVHSFDEYLSDLGQFLGRVRERKPGKAIFVLGHSMGGTIASLFAITRQPDLGGLILSAAAVKLSEDISPLLVRLSPIIGSIAPKLPTLKLDSALMSRDPKWCRAMTMIRSYTAAARWQGLVRNSR